MKDDKTPTNIAQHRSKKQGKKDPLAAKSFKEQVDAEKHNLRVARDHFAAKGGESGDRLASFFEKMALSHEAKQKKDNLDLGLPEDFFYDIETGFDYIKYWEENSPEVLEMRQKALDWDEQEEDWYDIARWLGVSWNVVSILVEAEHMGKPLKQILEESAARKTELAKQEPRSAFSYDRQNLFRRMSKADDLYAGGNYQEAADEYKQAAESYRRLGGRMQQEINEAKSESSRRYRDLSVLQDWMSKFRKPRKLPVKVLGLTEERLWKILADLQEKPEHKDVFDVIYDRLQREGELMTLRGRERGMYLGLFGLTEYPRKGFMRPDQELLVEAVLEKFHRAEDER